IFALRWRIRPAPELIATRGHPRTRRPRPGLRPIGFYLAPWHGIWAPKGMRYIIVEKPNAAVVDALADPGVRQRLVDPGSNTPPREEQTPEWLRAFHKAEVEKWWPIIKAAGIRAE